MRPCSVAAALPTDERLAACDVGAVVDAAPFVLVDATSIPFALAGIRREGWAFSAALSIQHTDDVRGGTPGTYRGDVTEAEEVGAVWRRRAGL